MRTRSLVFLFAWLFSLSSGTFSHTPALAEVPALSKSSYPSDKIHTPDPSAATLQYLIIPAAALRPAHPDVDYELHGRYLIHFGRAGLPDPATYYAPVQLPQGARITKITYFWRDGGVGDTNAVIYRHLKFTDINEMVAGVPTSTDTWAPSFGSSYSPVQNFSIDQPVNNFSYSYYLQLGLPAGGAVWACAFQVEYQPATQVYTSGVVNIPLAAFTPYQDGFDYYNGGWYQYHIDGPSTLQNRGWYNAPLLLPDGAQITGMTFHWQRNNTQEIGMAYIQRSLISSGNYEVVGVVSSSPGSNTYTGFSTANFNPAPFVLNAIYSYWIVLDLPPSPSMELVARSVDVSYTMPAASVPVLSIPVSAFHPYEDGYDFQNDSRSLTHQHGPGGSFSNGWYIAPIHLPDGALVKRMDFRWFENTGVAGVARLQRSELNQGNYTNLAVAVTTTGTNSEGVSSDSSVEGGPVDNSRYAYWLVIDLPANAVLANFIRARSVQVWYVRQVFLPAVRK